MKEIEITVITNQNKRILLKQLVTVDWQSDRFSPADSLEFVYLDPLEEVISQVEARQAGRLFFRGIVDKQQTQVDHDGVRRMLSCRSFGALLLDNEARPGVYWWLSVERLLKEHGMGVIKKTAFSSNSVLPQFTVQKGMSHWEVICYFCRRVFGCTPFLGRENQLMLYPFSEKKHLFSNSHVNAIHYHSASMVQDRYRMISKVWIKDSKLDGYYSRVLNNQVAQNLDVQRERYYHPGILWGEQDFFKSAELLIKEQQLDYQELDLVLPGNFDICVGDFAEFQDQQIGTYHKQYISKLTFHWGKDGVVTRVKLWDQAVI